MARIEELVVNNRHYVEHTVHRVLPTEPSRRLAVLTCMDSRLDLFGALGLDLGECHLIRNAGGVATPDVLRSLILSQRLLQTNAIMVVHHTRCGLENIDEAALRQKLVRDTGVDVDFAFGSFVDLDDHVRETVTFLRSSPFLRTLEIRGFAFDVDSGALREVFSPTEAS